MLSNSHAIFLGPFTLPDDYFHNFSLLRPLMSHSPSLLSIVSGKLQALSRLPTLVKDSLSIRGLHPTLLLDKQVHCQ